MRLWVRWHDLLLRVHLAAPVRLVDLGKVRLRDEAVAQHPSRAQVFAQDVHHASRPEPRGVHRVLRGRHPRARGVPRGSSDACDAVRALPRLEGTTAAARRSPAGFEMLLAEGAIVCRPRSTRGRAWKGRLPDVRGRRRVSGHRRTVTRRIRDHKPDRTTPRGAGARPLLDRKMVGEDEGVRGIRPDGWGANLFVTDTDSRTTD